MDTQEVDGNPREGDGNANQGVDSVAVEGDRHQEDGAQAEHHRVQQSQLWREKPGRDAVSNNDTFIFNIISPPAQCFKGSV